MLGLEQTRLTGKTWIWIEAEFSKKKKKVLFLPDKREKGLPNKAEK